jgi:transcription elongation factor Elf1
MAILQATDFDNVNRFIASRGDFDVRQDYIDELEPMFVYQILGSTLANLFYAAYEAAEVEPEEGEEQITIDERYSNLWNGCKYVVDEVSRNLIGLKKAAQYFIISEYLKSEFNQKTANGIVILQSSESVTVSPWPAIVESQNKCSQICGAFCEIDYSTLHTFLTEKIDVYPEFEDSAFIGLDKENLLGL